MQWSYADAPPLTLQDDPGRPPGLHVSQIISSLLQVIDKARYSGDPDYLKVTSGIGLERSLEALIGQHYLGGFRPVPILLDGIWMSPDHIAFDPWRVREFKLTWYSLGSKPCPEDDVYWPWRVQTMAYCKGVGTTLGEWWPLFVNGNYKPPRPCLGRVGDPAIIKLEFSQMEIDENWDMLRSHAVSQGWL